VALAGEVIAPGICRQAAALFGLHDVFVVGFGTERFVGGVSIITRRPGMVLRGATIEALARVAAVVIERKRVEQTLQASEAELRLLVGESPDPIFTFGPDRRYRYANRAFAEGVGRSPAEIVGRTIADVFGAEEASHREPALLRVLSTGVEEGIEVRVPRPDGDRYYVTTITPLRDAQGQVTMALCSSKEITRRKRAEEALRESEERYRSFVEQAREGIYQTTPDGRYLSANPALARMFGYASPEELVAQVTDLATQIYVRAEDREHLTAALIDPGHVEGFEAEVRRRDGTTFWISINAHAVRDAEGRLLRFEATHTDISERKRAEEERARLQAELFQAQKLEAIGTLAGGVAHDFNNILGGILGRLSLLRLDLGEESPHQGELQEMMALVERGADLARQLLGFARRGKYDARPLDLARVVEKTSAMFGRTRRDITIQLDLAPELPAVVMDHTQLEQVLLNLFLNAGQAMQDGGRLLLRAAPVRLSDAETVLHGLAVRPFVRLVVADTGVGMDAATRARIFEPFFTTKAPGQGTGLGLASAYGILKHHGGLIEVDSEPGAGTTFTLLLPACEQRPAGEPPPARAALEQGRGTVLIVDDEEQMVRLCERMLARMGYQVLTAAGGAEAIELVRAHEARISLVILDLIMPGMSGARTYEAVRELAPGVKVLLCSGYSLDGQAQELLDRGCQGFIQKPFSASALSAKLRELL